MTPNPSEKKTPVGLKHGERIATCEHVDGKTPAHIVESDPFDFETDRGMMLLTHIALCDACLKASIFRGKVDDFLKRHARYDGPDYMPDSWNKLAECEPEKK